MEDPNNDPRQFHLPGVDLPGEGEPPLNPLDFLSESFIGFVPDAII